MKQIIALLLLFLLLFSFVSCKKNNEEQGKNTKLLKTIEISDTESGNLQYLLTHYYDNHDRLIKVNYSSPEAQFDFYTIKYLTNAIIIIDFENKADTLQLGENGYVISQKTFLGNLYTFTYENGYIKEVKSENGRKTEYFWKNGNMVQTTSYNNDSLQGSTYYEYNSIEDLSNFSDLTGLIYDMQRISIKGFASKNYLVKMTTHLKDPEPPEPEKGIIYETQINTFDRILTYDYKFDKDGYPTEIIRSVDGIENNKCILTYY
jgi:hypothetical protein